MSKKYYLTTPLYYVNDIPHIGHAYTTVAADVLARYKRQLGCEVFFLTGTDEHGDKIWNAAKQKGQETQLFVDEVVKGFKKAWEALNISYDAFIRTTDKKHEAVVQNVFHTLLSQGDIYKGEYEGWYCTPCETYWAELELKDDIDGRKLCPDCGRATDRLKEETYFFKLSKYQDQLLNHIESNDSFIQPASRRNEITQFIKQGLRDLSVTRTAFPWGVGVPDDPKHVVYVWFDALLNYISAIGYLDNKEEFNKLWPADVHLMGKEIVRFHAVIWPALLMALNLPLPKVVFGHGWWTVEGKKMSKSKGNVVDPLALSSEFGVDAVRYFLLREVPFGTDGDFSMNAFIARFNADLANDIGNLLSRTLTMVEKYYDKVIPSIPNERNFDDLSNELTSESGLSGAAKHFRNKLIDQFAFSNALEAIWRLISKANNYIEKEAPWKLAKAGEKDKLAAVMYNLCEALQTIAYLIAPFMPATADKMWKQLGLSGPSSLEAKIDGITIAKGEPLFPRIQK